MSEMIPAERESNGVSKSKDKLTNKKLQKTLPEMSPKTQPDPSQPPHDSAPELIVPRSFEGPGEERPVRFNLVSWNRE